MNPDNMISAETLFTLGGGALAVTIFANVIEYVFGWRARWFGLVTALAIAELGAYFATNRSWLGVVIAFFQGLQIYATAVGIATVTGQGDADRERSWPNGAKPTRRVLWPKWF